MRRTTRTLLTPLLLLLLLAAKPADPESLLLCTDLGPLLATRTGDGDLMGSLRGRWPVSGSDASLQIGLPGGGSWTTTLADLHPTAPEAPSAPPRRVGELLEPAGRPPSPLPPSAHSRARAAPTAVRADVTRAAHVASRSSPPGAAPLQAAIEIARPPPPRTLE